MTSLPAPIFAPIADALARVEEIVADAQSGCAGAVADVLAGPWVGRGKRLRPALAIHAARAGGGDPAEAPALGAAVELLHLASLLHDDFIDGAATRRGAPSAHARFGPRSALLAGDFLFARALALVTDAAGLEGVRVAIAAARDMIEGESIEVARACDLALGADEAIGIARRKTASLFSAACRLGATAGGASGAEIEALARFGDHLGTAFQIADDSLDLRGTREALGKEPGADIREGNLSLPLVYAASELSAEAVARLRASFGRADATDAEVRAILRDVAATAGVARAMGVAQGHAQVAEGALATVRDDGVRAALGACLDFALGRVA